MLLLVVDGCFRCLRGNYTSPHSAVVGIPLLDLQFTFWLVQIKSYVFAILSYSFLLGTSPDTRRYILLFILQTMNMSLCVFESPSSVHELVPGLAVSPRFFENSIKRISRCKLWGSLINKLAMCLYCQNKKHVFLGFHWAVTLITYFSPYFSVRYICRKFHSSTPTTVTCIVLAKEYMVSLYFLVG